MKLLFVLSMPGNNSWNGRWSGEEDFYGVVRNVGTSKKALARIKPILAEGYYTYSFGDGWVAGVTVTEATVADVKRVRKSSHGFRGYDWMIDSIMEYGRILNSMQQREQREAASTQNSGENV